MRGNCERCGADLPADAEAMICVYECTFCPACTQAMAGVCPNCGGELVRRPRAQSSGDSSTRSSAGSVRRGAG
jgi:hypothetical protein